MTEIPLDSLDGKIFFLGIGAQKAGTSWLHDYFASREDVFVPDMKELHYFDAKFRPDLCSRFDRQMVNRLRVILRKTLKNPNMLLALRDADTLLARVRMIFDENEYRRYFAGRVAAKHLCYGEITPSYAILGEEGFAEIKRQFSLSKIIFILRDPVERFYSALRMRERDQRGFSAFNNFFESLAKRNAVERTQYEETIKELDKVFSPEDVFVGFYETLFTDENINRLCAFLNIPFVTGQYSIVKNPSPLAIQLDAKRIQAGLLAFQSTYEFCEKRYGEAIPDSWYSHRA
jgi:hypothetical protein